MTTPLGAAKNVLKTQPKRVTEEQFFEAPVTFSVLPKQFVDTLRTATPNVENLLFFKSHADPTLVTDFLFGQNGQILSILGNGNTTVSNNTKIKTNTGSNKLLTADKVYRFTYFDGIWYEDAD